MWIELGADFPSQYFETAVLQHHRLSTAVLDRVHQASLVNALSDWPKFADSVNVLFWAGKIGEFWLVFSNFLIESSELTPR